MVDLPFSMFYYYCTPGRSARSQLSPSLDGSHLFGVPCCQDSLMKLQSAVIAEAKSANNDMQDRDSWVRSH